MLAAAPALAQYARSTGANAPSIEVQRRAVTDDKTGQTRYVEVNTQVTKDRWGNANGNQHDLAFDGAFDGQTIVVLHFYTAEGFNFLPLVNEAPKPAALRANYERFGDRVVGAAFKKAKQD